MDAHRVDGLTGYAQRSTHFQLAGDSSEFYDRTLGARIVNKQPSNHVTSSVEHARYSSSSLRQGMRNFDSQSMKLPERVIPTAHEIQQKNRASNIFSGAHHDAVHPAAQVQVQQVSPDRPPTQDDAAGRPLQSYGESSGPASPFGVYHNPVGLASHWHTADMDPRSTSANEAQRHTGPLAIDRALKQQFLQSAAVVNTLQSEAAQGSAPVCSSDTMKSAVRAVSSSPPSAMPSSYPVTAAALRELHSTPLVSLIDGESRSPPRHTPLPGPAHEFVPASASRLARQALYASGNTAEGMMAGPANRAPMTLMESTWGADGALRSARYAPAGVPAGGRWDRPGEVTHPALAHAARQRLLQGSIPPGHLG